jgi:hypothetical protein
VPAKQHLVDSMTDEIRIIRHLARKIPPGTLAWRPSPGQRSTLELLRYLSTFAIDLAREVVSGGFDVAHVTGKAPKDLPAEAFDAAMEKQRRDLVALLAPFDDRALRERGAMLPGGARTTLEVALMNVVLKALVAYRMQLFLYAKGSGNAALSTLDCWHGVDPPPAVTSTSRPPPG